MTSILKEGANNSTQKYKKIFAKSIGLKQYLAEQNIKWDCCTISAFEIPVRLSYQMISNQSLYEVGAQRKGYVFPRHFLDSYMKCVSHKKVQVKKFAKYICHGTALGQGLASGIREPIAMYTHHSITYSERLDFDQLGRAAKRMRISLDLPNYEIIFFDRKIGQLIPAPEYPRSLLDSIDWLGRADKRD